MTAALVAPGSGVWITAPLVAGLVALAVVAPRVSRWIDRRIDEEVRDA